MSGLPSSNRREGYKPATFGVENAHIVHSSGKGRARVAPNFCANHSEFSGQFFFRGFFCLNFADFWKVIKCQIFAVPTCSLFQLNANYSFKLRGGDYARKMS